MSEIAIGRREPSSEGAFNRATMLLVAAVGALAFLAMLVLGAYAPELGSGRNGGAHALSNAATGYSGLVRLAEMTGRKPRIVRAEHQLNTEALAVVTPEHAGVDLGEVLELRGPRATLVILPKWSTEKHEFRPGWVRVRNLLPPLEPEGVLAPANEFKITRFRGSGQPLVTAPDYAPPELRFTAPAVVQMFSGKNLEPIITDRAGRILLAKVEQKPLYVLSDPDLLNNHGMTHQRQAAAALALLDFLNTTDANEVLFDVTLNGLGRSRSPLRLAFDPPFLAVTLAILAALALAAVQGAFRFGAPRRPERAIAFGKAALVDNSAALVRKAGRESRLGPRYVDVIRERAAALFHTRGTGSKALVERLDALSPARSFSELARTASTARSRDELLSAARALHRWLEEVKA